MTLKFFATCLMVVISLSTAVAQTIPATDPTSDFDRPFGLGGRSCKQYDDTGRLFIYTEGLPSIGVISWLQQSDGGTKANVPMPQELAVALPKIPGCMPGKHHAARSNVQSHQDGGSEKPEVIVQQ